MGGTDHPTDRRPSWGHKNRSDRLCFEANKAVATNIPSGALLSLPLWIGRKGTDWLKEGSPTAPHPPRDSFIDCCDVLRICACKSARHGTALLRSWQPSSIPSPSLGVWHYLRSVPLFNVIPTTFACGPLLQDVSCFDPGLLCCS